MLVSSRRAVCAVKVRRGERSVRDFEPIKRIATKLDCSPEALTLAMMVERYHLIPIGEHCHIFR
jgi:hypothetical protein